MELNYLFIQCKIVQKCSVFRENNIGAPKLRNNFVAIKYALFQYCDSSIELFSINPRNVIALNLLCFYFGIKQISFAFHYRLYE